jgi:hypothetical protein
MACGKATFNHFTAHWRNCATSFYAREDPGVGSCACLPVLTHRLCACMHTMASHSCQPAFQMRTAAGAWPCITAPTRCPWRTTTRQPTAFVIRTCGQR